MKEKFRKLVMSLVFICGVVTILGCNCTNTRAMESTSNITEQESSNSLALITTEANSTSLLASSTSGADGKVSGDGVRLRKAPSTTAKILELMYKGDLVVIQKK